MKTLILKVAAIATVSMTTIGLAPAAFGEDASAVPAATAAPPALVQVAALSPPGPSGTATVPSAAAEAQPPAATPAADESRCERVRRIGKFTRTRCD